MSAISSGYIPTHATRFNRALGVNGASMFFNLQIPFGLDNFNRLIEYRAAVQACANDFLFMFCISLPVFLVTWLMKRPHFQQHPR